jgi:hypothetical protein
MKAYHVTALFEGKVESWTTYGHDSVSGVKKSVTNYWNKNLIYGAKIVRVEPLGETDEIVWESEE